MSDWVLAADGFSDRRTGNDIQSVINSVGVGIIYIKPGGRVGEVTASPRVMEHCRYSEGAQYRYDGAQYRCDGAFSTER